MYFESLAKSRDHIEFKKAKQNFYGKALTAALELDIIKAWDESEHPREDNGRFANTDTSDSAKPTLTNAAGKPIIVVQRTEIMGGPPNGITQKVNAKGGIDRNYYDSGGRQILQISNYDHGNPKQHPFGEHGEHAHDYIYDVKGRLIKRSTRELIDEEKLENGDML